MALDGKSAASTGVSQVWEFCRSHGLFLFLVLPVCQAPTEAAPGEAAKGTYTGLSKLEEFMVDVTGYGKFKERALAVLAVNEV